MIAFIEADPLIGYNPNNVPLDGNLGSIIDTDENIQNF